MTGPRLVKKVLKGTTTAPRSTAPAVPQAVYPHAGKDGTVTFVDNRAMTGRRSVGMGIDASVTGLSVALVDAEGAYFIWRLTPKTKVSRQGEGKPYRLREIDEFLENRFRNIKAQSQVQHVCLEGYAFTSAMATTAGEVGGLVRLKLLKHFKEPVGFPTIPVPSQLKKFITGSGKGDKNVILKAVYKRWGLDVSDDNMADAFGLAKMALAISTGDTDYGYEADVLAKLRPHSEWDQQSRLEMAADSPPARSRKTAAS